MKKLPPNESTTAQEGPPSPMNEERWRLAILGANDGIWDWNLKTNEVFYSTRWKEMLGFSEEEIGSALDEWQKRVHPEDLPHVLQTIQDHCERRAPFYKSEHRLRCKDGRYKWVLDRGQALWDEEGKAIRMVGTHMDISDRKEAEEDLLRTTKRLALLHETDCSILAARSIEELVRSILPQQRALVACDWASVVMFAPDKQEATILAIDTTTPSQLAEGAGFPLEAWGDPADLCQDRIFFEQDLLSHTSLPAVLARLREERLRSYLRLPLVSQEKVVGVLYLARLASVPFPIQDIEIAQEVANQLAVAIQQARLREELQGNASALQKERDFAEGLIETAQAIILVLDREGRVVRFNRYLEELSGYRLQDVQGQDWFSTFISDSEQQRLRDQFLQVLQKHHMRGTDWIRLKNTQLRNIEWSAKVLEDQQGSLVGLLAIGQDVTERENAQVALHSLIQTTQDAVVTIDHQGRIDLFNPAAERVFGHAREEVKGQDVKMLMPEPYASEHESYIERYTRTGERRAIGRIRTVAAQRKNGQVFPIELSVTEIRTTDSVRYGAFIRDISEKVRLQEQLVERERLAAIGTTAATFAHEVGNPLNSMYMSAQILERRLSKQREGHNETLLAPLRNLMSEMKRLLALLTEFRSLARRQKLNLKPLSLAHLVEDLCKAEALYHAEHHITLEQQLPPDLPLIEADAERLKQVLLNLCKNATEAMPTGGKITVRAHHNKERVYLDISDTGIGIPSGVDIFEPFATTKSQGTGLGLTIVRQIVAAHRGTLTYRTNPDVGTTFTLEMPIRQTFNP